MSNIERRIDTFLDNAASQLHQYVHGPNCKANVLKHADKWNRLTIRQQLITCIENETIAWQKTHIDSIFQKDIIETLMKNFEYMHTSLHSIKEDLKGFKTPFDVDRKIAAILISLVLTGGTMALSSVMLNRIAPHFSIPKDAVVLGCAIGGLVEYLEVVYDFETVCEKEFQARINFLTKKELKSFLRKNLLDVTQKIMKSFLDEEIKKEIGMLQNTIVTMREGHNIFKSNKDILLSLKSAVVQNIERLQQLRNPTYFLARKATAAITL